MQLGNMQISDHEGRLKKATCHCGKEFVVSGLEFAKDGTIVKHQLTGKLNFVTVEGFKILCPACKCPWTLGKSEPEDRYFVAYVTIDGKEVEFALGLAYDMTHFLALTMSIISKYAPSSLRVTEITQEEAERIRSRARSSLIDYLETLLSR